LVITGAASLLVIVLIFAAPNRLPHDACSLLVALEAAIGFLLMSLTSATSLAEERARGSLDVLLSTPLSTPSIVWGKWRGDVPAGGRRPLLAVRAPRRDGPPPDAPRAGVRLLRAAPVRDRLGRVRL